MSWLAAKQVHTKNYFNSNKKRFWTGIFLVQFFLFYLLSKSERAVEFFNRFFEFKKSGQQNLISQFSFSVGDLFYIILIVALFYIIFRIFKKENRNRSMIHLLIIFNVLYFFYQISWGMLYFQKSILSQLPGREITIYEAKQLSLKYLNLSINDRKNVNEDQKGVFKIDDLNAIQNSILETQYHLPKNFVSKKATGINAFKSSLFEGVMSYTGISGYYNPFSAEAQYNPQLPATSLPFTLAHESAHQMGFAREQEASFVGFLMGKDSQNNELKYATHLYALKSLLGYVATRDSVFVKNTVQKYSPGMERDRQYEKNFRKEHQGYLDDVFGFTNNLFLKSNRQEGSITYSYFTELLMKYERINNAQKKNRAIRHDSQHK